MHFDALRETPTARGRRAEYGRILARCADLVAVTAVTITAWLLWLDGTFAFQTWALVTASVGVFGALISKETLRTPLDWPVLSFGALSVLSAAVARFSDRSGSAALEIMALILFYYGAAWTLRTPFRLRALAAVFVVASLAIGTQALLFHASVGIVFRIADYPTMPQWVGYPELGLLLALAIPFAASVPIVVAGQWTLAVSATLVLAMLGFEEFVLYARAGLMALIVADVALAAFEFKQWRTWKLALAFPVVGVIVVAAFRRATFLAEIGRTAGDYYVTRLRIWSAVLAVIRDHWAVGVGPGNLQHVFVAGYADENVGLIGLHPHNMILQVAAETGVVGAVVFVLIWVVALVRLGRRSAARTRLGAVQMGLFGSLVVFFAYGLVHRDPHSFGVLPIVSTRFNLLLWGLLAAAAALDRLPQPSAPRRLEG